MALQFHHRMFNVSNDLVLGTATGVHLSGSNAFGTGAGLGSELGAYWQNRAILSGTKGNITLSTEAGTAAGNNLEVQVMNATYATAANTGGLFSNPALYNSSNPAPPAIQGIITLNITSTATLDLLLAAFLDNTTAGVNGTFQLVTNQVGFLGFCNSVVGAISNQTQVSDGLYGPPTVVVPQQSSGFWGIFWNDVTSVFTNPAGTVLSLINTVWNFATAAFTYFNHLLHEASAIGGKILSRTAATLVSVGKVVLSALTSFFTWLWQQLTKFFDAVVAPVGAAFKSAITAWTGHLYTAANDTLAAYQGKNTASNIAQAALNLNDFMAPLIIGATAIVIAVEVLLGLAAPFDVGAATLIGFAVPLILSALSGSLKGSSSSSWLGTVLSELDTGTAVTLTAFGSVMQWFLNKTYGDIVTAAGKVASSVPGDFPSLLTLILGGVSSFMVCWGFSTHYSGLSESVEDLSALQETDTASDSVQGLVYGLIAVFLLAFEYIISLGSPSGVWYDAQMILACLALGLGFFSIVFGGFAISGEELGDTPLVAWTGEGLGLLSEASGAWDVYSGLSSGPP